MTAMERVRVALEEHGQRVTGTGGQLKAQCPAHPDNEPSLSITAADDRVLLHCHAGCTGQPPHADPKPVLDALGLTAADLFDAPLPKSEPSTRQETHYEYRNADGQVVGRVTRRYPKKFLQSRPNGRGGWEWKASADLKVTPYRLPEVLAAISRGETVYVAEGEKDVHTLAARGVTATCNAGGAEKWTEAHAKHLRGAQVVVVRDNDDAGHRHGDVVMRTLAKVAASVRLVDVADGCKDVTDHLSAGHGLENLREVTPAAPVQDGQEPAFPVPDTGGEEHGNVLYADIGALLDGGIPEPPKPILLHREDGHAVFYKAMVNYLFGDPESGKTWVAQAAATEALRDRRKVLFIDIDHNGVDATVYRFLDMGVEEETLRDIDLFRYVAPEDQAHLVAVVADAKEWRPAVAVVDSVGELLPMLRLSSNSPDDFTNAHTAVLKPLAAAGAAVLAIDHLPKNAENRANGPTGTAAKRRAIGGVSIRVTIKEQFTPGRGGEAYLSVNKDRHGGLRRYCPVEGREPSAGLFVLDSSGDGITWKVQAPKLGEAAAADGVSAEDLAAVDQLDPPPESVRDAKTRLKWGTSRAAKVLSEWRSQRSRNVPEEHGTTLGDERSPFPPPGVRNGEQHEGSTKGARHATPLPSLPSLLPSSAEQAPGCRTCGQRLLTIDSQQRGWCERDHCKLANKEAS